MRKNQFKKKLTDNLRDFKSLRKNKMKKQNSNKFGDIVELNDLRCKK